TRDRAPLRGGPAPRAGAGGSKGRGPRSPPERRDRRWRSSRDGYLRCPQSAALSVLRSALRSSIVAAGLERVATLPIGSLGAPALDRIRTRVVEMFDTERSLPPRVVKASAEGVDGGCFCRVAVGREDAVPFLQS